MLRISPMFIPALLAAVNYLPASEFVGFVTAVAAHEAGHIFAVKLLRRRVCGAALTPFGVTLQCPLSSYRDDMLCAAAGPAASFLFAAAALVGASAYTASPAAYISLMLGALNLLPAQGLDGGVILSSYLSLKSGLPPPHRAERYVNAAAVFLLFSVSCFILIGSGDNPTMLIFCLGLMMKEK